MVLCNFIHYKRKKKNLLIKTVHPSNANFNANIMYCICGYGGATTMQFIKPEQAPAKSYRGCEQSD